MKKILIFLFIVGSFLIVKSASATQYFIDSSCATPGNGTTTTCDGDANDSYDNLSDFTAAAKVAGDIATLRGGIASGYDTDGSADLVFTSDGTIPAPITIERDYDNNWNDAWTSSSQTYTVALHLTTWEAAASVTGIDTGDWVWVDDEDNRQFAYEVASCVSTTCTTYLPYKGNSAGVGLTLNNMKENPYWGAVTGNYQWLVSGDNYWNFQGIKVMGTDLAGVLEFLGCVGHKVKDFIVIANDASDYGITFSSVADVRIFKTRIANASFGLVAGVGTTSGKISINDSVFTPGSGTSNLISFGSGTGALNMSIRDTYCTALPTTTISAMSGEVGTWSLINFISCGDTIYQGSSYLTLFKYLFSDSEGIVGANRSQYMYMKMIRDDTIVRAGGGSTSLWLASASSNLNTDWELSQLNLFEYPIYADTTNKTYTMYFMATASAEFTAVPTAAQMWIECEFYGGATGAYRKTTKSTEVITANGTWYPLSVTCQPTQSGVLYLRGWYAKTLETGKDNNVFMDVAPVISTP